MGFFEHAEHGYQFIVPTVYSGAQSGVEVLAAQSGKRIVIDKIIFSRDQAGTMKLLSASTDVTNTFYFDAKGGVVLDDLRLVCGNTEALSITTTGDGDHSILLRYYTQ